MEKQLNVWIDGTLKQALHERAQEEKVSIKELTEEIIHKDMARRRGELIEQETFAMIRDVIQSEQQRAMTQLRMEIREEVHEEIIEQMKTISRRSDERIAALVVRAVRDASINRRLVYALLAKTYGQAFAHSAYENAREKACEELQGRVHKHYDESE